MLLFPTPICCVQSPADAGRAQAARAAAEAQILSEAAAKVGSCFWLGGCASCSDPSAFALQAEAESAEARRLEEVREAAAKVCVH